MNNNIPSESNKNTKALVTTLVLHGLLLLMFFLIAFKEPIPPVYPPPGEGIEVNLGNSDQGFGDVQPLVPGEPAPAQEEQLSSPPKTSQPETVKEATPDDPNGDEEVAKKLVVTKPTTKPKPEVNKETPKKNPSPATVTNPTPAPPKPKATYKGGTGTGGNNADDYNNSKNQGIAGGKGDQGKPNGNPNSDSYAGNGGSGKSVGPKVYGNRKIVKYYSFTGDLDKATVYATVRVSPSGIGTFLGFDKRSTSRSQAYADAIISYLRNIQFDKSTDESTVVVQFNFNVR